MNEDWELKATTGGARFLTCMMTRNWPKATLSGEHGQAWLSRFQPVGPHSGLALWIMEATWAHPFWPCYMLSLVHLRFVVGLPEPIIHLPGATHEMLLYAINPDWRGSLSEAPELLHPANFGAQLKEPDDRSALKKVKDAVRLVCRGKLNPDTDCRQQWIERFGDNMIVNHSVDRQDPGLN